MVLCRDLVRLLGLPAVVAAVTLAMPALAEADVLYWGNPGTGNGQFSDPFNVAVDPNAGDVYVTDELNHRVQYFTADGTYLGQWSSFGGGQSNPSGIGVSPAGKVFVAANNTAHINGTALLHVQRFLVDGTFDTGWTQDIGPNWGYPSVFPLAVSGAEVYVVDRSNRKIMRFDTDGNLLGSFGSVGSGDGQFEEIVGIAVNQSTGNVYVADAGENFPGPPPIPPSIQEFTAAGNFIRRWGSEGSGSGQFHNLTGVAVAPDGDVYTTEQGPQGIQQFSSTGQLTASYPSPVASGGLAATSNYIYVTDPGGGRVARIDLVTPTASFSAPSQTLSGQPVTFDASTSSVPLGQISDYQWDLDGNGTYENDTGTTAAVSHSYDSRGHVDVGLKVTSDRGGTSTTTHGLDVFLSSRPGPIGVSINAGAQFTNDPNVMVSARWPTYATDLYISNDGGFSPYTQEPVNDEIPWQLDSSGPERLPKTIYVRFLGGQSGPETYQDDIILDQTAPAIESVQAKHKTAKILGLTIKAKDKVSGVAEMQVTVKKRRPGKWVSYRSKTRLKTRGSKAFVRLRDRAGNVSSWKKASA